jgi:hypothetical protein
MVVDASVEDLKIEKLLKTTSVFIAAVLIISSLLLVYMNLF